MSTAVRWEGNRSMLGQVLISISAQVMMTVAVLCVGNEERDVPELPCLPSSQVQLVSSFCRCNSQGRRIIAPVTAQYQFHPAHLSAASRYLPGGSAEVGLSPP